MNDSAVTPWTAVALQLLPRMHHSKIDVVDPIEQPTLTSLVPSRINLSILALNNTSLDCLDSFSSSLFDLFVQHSLLPNPKIVIRPIKKAHPGAPI